MALGRFPDSSQGSGPPLGAGERGQGRGVNGNGGEVITAI